MTIQDWGITYAELEPYYDKFEYTAAVSGKAGNINGQIQPGGNPFEAPRAREYPLPPLTPILASEMFSDAARNAGYHPFPRPSANASQAYTNPDGAKFGACQYCGYCQRFGCEANAKGSPHMTVIPIAMKNANFELRTHSWVTKVLKDSSGKRVTGVTYTNVMNGQEFEQPAGVVVLCAYAINNVHLMGSSRPASRSLKNLGISCVLAESINGLFFRNCVNYAFPAMECPGVSDLFAEGDLAQVNFDDGAVRNKTTGKALKANVLPAKLLDLLQAGGIYPLLELKGIIEPQT